MIKAKVDAQQFIEQFSQYANQFNHSEGEHSFEYQVGSFGHYGQGFTQLWVDEDGNWYIYSHGKNWMDRSPSHINNPVDYIWKERKWINKQLRRNQFGDEI